LEEKNIAESLNKNEMLNMRSTHSGLAHQGFAKGDSTGGLGE